MSLILAVVPESGAVPQARARVGAALQRLRQAQRPWLAWGASGHHRRRWLRREAACPARPWQRAALFGGGDGLASCTCKAVRRRSSYVPRHRLEAPATLPRQQLHTAPRATPGRAGRRAARGCALRSRPLAALRLSTSHHMQTAVPAAAPSGNGAAPSAAGVTGKGRLSIVMPPSPPDSRPATCEDGGQQTGNALVEVGPRSPRPSGGGSDRTPRRSSGGTPREGRPPLARQSSGGGGRGAFGSSTPRFSGATDGEGSRSGRLSRGDGERGRSPSESGGGDGARQPRVSGSAARPPRRLSATGVALSDARREQLGRIERVRTRPGACAALTSKRADRTRPAN